jgi:phosphoribosyl-dephospho-CoA transferase
MRHVIEANEEGGDLVNETRPHDLLRISGAEALAACCAPPQWVQDAMNAMPVVVVRRALRRDDGIPVGVRGKLRAERFAAYLPTGAVQERITPEDLANTMHWRDNQRLEFAGIREALDAIAFHWNLFAWGIAGSVGFELATGVPSTTCNSDLDLIIRAPLPVTKPEAEYLLQSAAALEVAIDVQIETPFGSVALKEYVSPHAPRLLMKTCDGPQLVADPWLDPCSNPPLAPPQREERKN